MSDLTAIFLMLVIFALVSVCSTFFLRRGHQRCDDIDGGVVDGVPRSLKYRRLLLSNDYVAASFSHTGVLLIVGLGYFVAAGVVSGEKVKLLAYLCGAGCFWAGLLNTIFLVSWILHLRSVLRQAERG